MLKVDNIIQLWRVVIPNKKKKKNIYIYIYNFKKIRLFFKIEI